MQFDNSRDQRQDLGVEKFRNSKQYGANINGRGTLVYTMGFGKTDVGMKIGTRFCLHNPTNNNTIILVPSGAIKKQWETRINSLTYNIELRVLTADEALKANVLYECGLLIVDELHKFYSEKRIELINQKRIKFKRNCGLTATYYDVEKRYKEIENLWPIIDTITAQEAEQKGWISKSFEFNISCELTENERQKYIELSKTISTQLPKFGKYKALIAAKYCLTGGVDSNGNFHNAITWATIIAKTNGWNSDLNFDLLEHKEINDVWNPHKVIGYAKSLMNAVRDRKDLLYNANNKYQIILDILKKYPDLKTICFSESTNFASQLCTEINKAFEDSKRAITYHSNMGSQPLKDDNGEWITYKSGVKAGQIKMHGQATLKKLAIKSIETGYCKVISTVSALDQGFNVEDIRLAITASGTQSPVQYQQRKGRATRKEDEDIAALIVNIYVEDTREEDWLRSRLEKNSRNTHWITDVDEISYTPKPIKNTFEIK